MTTDYSRPGVEPYWHAHWAADRVTRHYGAFDPADCATCQQEAADAA
jgi:hypothetical protein